MELQDVLDRRCVAADVSADSKDEVLRELAALAVKSPVLSDQGEDEVYRLLREREDQGSTGFEAAVAIPHASVEQVDEFVVGVLTTSRPVDFAAMDGKPSQLFFFIIGPKGQRARHVSLLSAISKVVRVEGRVEELIGAQSPDELFDRTLGSIVFRSQQVAEGPASMVHVFIQRDDLFEDILQVFSETTETSIFVDEVQDAGAYLHELPLFSALWTESPRTSVTHIRAVVRTSQTNDIVRKISLLDDDIFEKAGVMIAVQELQYFTGSIEL